MAGFKNGNPGCCCDPPNPCSCTWPAVLTYIGSVNQAQSASYFANIYSGGGTEPSSYTLTYGPRPAAIPEEMEVLFITYPAAVPPPAYITMPDDAWWSGPVTATNFGATVDVYFYLWFHACAANVTVINAPYSTGTAPADTRGAASKIHLYSPLTCTPFAMRSSPFVFVPEVTGTHGGGDVVPDALGGGSEWRNLRSGGTSYTLTLVGNFGPTVAHGTGSLTAALTMPSLTVWTPGPGDTVAWSSSNTSVVTLTGGGSAVTVNAVAAGTATITAAVTTTRSVPTGGPFTLAVTVT
jgi:hypothetical protein